MGLVRDFAKRANVISGLLGQLSTEEKNKLLESIAGGLEKDAQNIIHSNERDQTAAKAKKLSPGLIDRLLLNEQRLRNIAADVRRVASLKDYVGDVLESRTLPNGLSLKRIRVPLGVIGIIYEARPNVTVDASVLCIKSGNAVILKGGSDALHTNRALVKSIQKALKSFRDAVQLIDTTDRSTTEELLTLRGMIDVIIPRGGKSLIDFVRKNARVPIIETGASPVHIFVDASADVKKAVTIVMNAKLRRVSICNTLDTLLLHKKSAKTFLKAFAAALPKNPYRADRLEVRADATSHAILSALSQSFSSPRSPSKRFLLNIKKAAPADYDTEFLDYVLAIKTVKNLDGALAHIAAHSLKHSEAIITEDARNAARFMNTVDAACVYWNASTQFSDGGQFGLGAEIGISTQKLHARGPFALEGLTSYKWVIEGNGQVRTP